MPEKNGGPPQSLAPSVASSPAGKARVSKRISRRLDAALRCVVFQAMSMEDAAGVVGMTKRGLLKALAKPHVKAHRRDLEYGRNEGLFVESIVTGAELMRSSASDKVRLAAAQWLHTLTDPEAHLKGSDTSKTLIININPPSDALGDAGGLIVDHASGVVKVQQKQRLSLEALDEDC